MASAPEWRTWAFSRSRTFAPCSAAVSAAMVPAVPPPMTRTSQVSSSASWRAGMTVAAALSVVLSIGRMTFHRRR